MARGRRDEEFPLLQPLGLKTIDILGDGNCLFSSLSDQVYGHTGKALEIRENVVGYMRQNRDDFKHFISVEAGGGHRRNPKRKNVAAPPVEVAVPTPTQVDQAFDKYLDRMAQNGCYGDNLEIRAFSKAYNADVKIYQADMIMCVLAENDGGSGSRPTAHIALHTWEHYSSIRNIDGPFIGPPNVKPLEMTPEKEAAVKSKASKGPYIHDWMVKNVMTSLPWAADEAFIRKVLAENKGNIDAAVTSLSEEPSSNATSPPSPGGSSQSGSDSIERDADSDDESIYPAPKKRQDRRKSRATKLQDALETQEANIPLLTLEKPEIDTSKDTLIPHSPPITILPQSSSLPPRTVLPPISTLPKGYDGPISPPMSPPMSPLSLGYDNIRQSKAYSSDEDAASQAADDNASDSASSTNSVSLLSTAPPKHTRLILHNTLNHTISKSPEPEKKPKRKLITAREKKELQKKAQKEARKERARKQGQATNSKKASTSKKSSTIKRTSSPVDIGGFNTMYI